MDFNLSENTTIIADTARRYLKDQYSFDTYRNVLVQSNHLNPSRWQTMQELGWFGLPFCEAVGGYGGDLIDVAMIVSEMGAALCLDPYVDMVVAPGKLLELADADKARQLLAGIIEGKAEVACALYDIHAGYDALSPSLVINSKRLSGQKGFVPDGGFAQSILATARTGGSWYWYMCACRTARSIITGRLTAHACPAFCSMMSCLMMMPSLLVAPRRKRQYNRRLPGCRR